MKHLKALTLGGFLFFVFLQEAVAAGGEAHEGVPVYMVIKQAVNFGIFVFLLGLIVKKFVPPFFSQRFEAFMAHKKQAQKVRQEAERRLQQMQSDLQNLQQQKARRLEAARQEAQKQAELKTQEAQAAARKLQASTELRLRKQWARKMRQLYTNLLEQVLSEAKLLVQKLPPEQQQKWQKDFISLFKREQVAAPSKAPLPRLAPSALPYARALFQLAQQKATSEQKQEVLQQLEEVHKALDARAQSFFNNPFVPQGQRLQALKKVLDALKLGADVRSFILLLAEKGRLNELADVVQAYKFQNDLKQNILRGQVQGLGEPNRKQVEQLVGQKLSLSDAKSSSSGVVLQMGGQTFDYSVASHLSKLKNNLTRRAEELWN